MLAKQLKSARINKKFTLKRNIEEQEVLYSRIHKLEEKGK